MTIPITVEAQTSSDFETRMQAYTERYVNQNIARFSKEVILSEDDISLTQEDIKLFCAEEAKSKFIHGNMKEYLDLYFPTSAMVTGEDTLVCDNGGFEDGFKYYKGYVNYIDYWFGSIDCRPLDRNHQPIIYIPTVIPLNRRFETVNSGIEPTFGINQTKFGSHAAKINSKYGHLGTCFGNRGVDKLVKRFKVTPETRDFTVWYAVALENPPGHTNQQPFLNINCDRDPQNELCFDADYLRCEQNYNDSLCQFVDVDLLDWSCHRFKIPKEFIDSIATLEIVVADCGLGDHFGFAYIDGICEECDSSALGSIQLDENIDYYSCNVDLASVCGTYTLPNICQDHWVPISVVVPGYDIYNIEIDTSNHSFCFDFPLSNFPSLDECLEIYAEIIFTDNGFDLPSQLSNTIEICKERYQSYAPYLEVSGCYDNETDDMLSDDYYFVDISIIGSENQTWYIERHLDNPYPNESGISSIYEGQTDGDFQLGPFLIQEGDWWLHLFIDGVECSYFIEAPDFCSGCDKFAGLEISNVKCYDNGFWSFDYFVHGNQTETYSIGNEINKSFGQLHQYPQLPIGINCLNLDLIWHGGQTDECKKTIIVCPPKPCDPETRCDLEVYVENIDCYKDKGGNVEYIVTLNISGEGNKQICYRATTISTPPVVIDQGSISNLTYPIIGPYSEDIYLTIYLCDPGVNCSTTLCYDCFKTIYIPKPDCLDRDRGMDNRSSTCNSLRELLVVPNPVMGDEFLLDSKLKETFFTLFDVSGQQLFNGKFSGREHKLKFSNPPGVYVIKYSDGGSSTRTIKFIKF